MTFTFGIASTIAFACSNDSVFGRMSAATPATSQISFDTRGEMRENSSSKKALSLYDFVSFAMPRRVPIWIPYGWGLMGTVFDGSSFVPRSNPLASPSGGWKMIRACGFTIAVLLRYSYTDCLPVM